MTKQNLEQKIGVMEKFRSVAGRTVGIYSLALALGVGMGGCEEENKTVCPRSEATYDYCVDYAGKEKCDGFCYDCKCYKSDSICECDCEWKSGMGASCSNKP